MFFKGRQSEKVIHFCLKVEKKIYHGGCENTLVPKNVDLAMSHLQMLKEKLFYVLCIQPNVGKD